MVKTFMNVIVPGAPQQERCKLNLVKTEQIRQ